jgi:Na+-translocating ferredoxin:NAD+ oxidoreductase subunit B
MKNNLAFIDSMACKLCRKCAPECPTHSILEIGFPVKKEKATENVSETPAEKEKTKEIDA